MNNRQIQVTANNVFQRIHDDFIYVVVDQRGHADYFLSSDIGPAAAMEWMKQEELFVDLVAKSEQPAVEYEKTLAGTTCRRITPIGEELYRILHVPSRCNPPNQQISEALKLWEEVKQRLNIRSAVYSGNPMSVIANGLLEGEFLNVIITRLREGTRRKRYQIAFQQRKNEARRTASSFTRLVTGIKKHRPGLFGVFFELMYLPEQASQIKLFQSAKHLCQLIDVLKDDPVLGVSVGHFWGRQFLSEAGYRTRLCLLFDEFTTPPDSIDWNFVLQQWKMSTKGAGVGFVRQDYICGADRLIWEIKCTAMRDLYLRLIPNTTYPHFGKSDMSYTTLTRSKVQQ